MVEIKWIEVESSNLDKLSYNQAEQKLYVKFKQRKAEEYYVYEDVDVVTFNALMVSESKGKFFAQEIRKTKKYEKVTDE